MSQLNLRDSIRAGKKREALMGYGHPGRAASITWVKARAVPLFDNVPAGTFDGPMGWQPLLAGLYVENVRDRAALEDRAGDAAQKFDWPGHAAALVQALLADAVGADGGGGDDDGDEGGEQAAAGGDDNVASASVLEAVTGPLERRIEELMRELDAAKGVRAAQTNAAHASAAQGTSALTMEDVEVVEPVHNSPEAMAKRMLPQITGALKWRVYRSIDINTLVRLITRKIEFDWRILMNRKEADFVMSDKDETLDMYDDAASAFGAIMTAMVHEQNLAVAGERLHAAARVVSMDGFLRESWATVRPAMERCIAFEKAAPAARRKLLEFYNELLSVNIGRIGQPEQPLQMVRALKSDLEKGMASQIVKARNSKRYEHEGAAAAGEGGSGKKRKTAKQPDSSQEQQPMVCKRSKTKAACSFPNCKYQHTDDVRPGT